MIFLTTKQHVNNCQLLISPSSTRSILRPDILEAPILLDRKALWLDLVPFSSPLRLRKSFSDAFIHLSAVFLSVSLGRKVQLSLVKSALAAAPAEGCFFIIVRLRTDAAAWRSQLSQPRSTEHVTWRGGQIPEYVSIIWLINTRIDIKVYCYGMSVWISILCNRRKRVL